MIGLDLELAISPDKRGLQLELQFNGSVLLSDLGVPWLRPLNFRTPNLSEHRDYV